VQKQAEPTAPANNQTKPLGNSAKAQGNNPAPPPTASSSRPIKAANKSFKDLMSGKAPVKQKEESKDEQPKTPVEAKDFTQADVQKAWTEACKQFANDPSLSTILDNVTPTKKGNEIHFQLNTQSQKNIFEQDIRPDLNIKLREILQNGHVVVKAQDAKVEENVQLKPKGPQERFDHLYKINPSIKKMRDAFDLDIE
jgi:hypothetical protein